MKWACTGIYLFIINNLEALKIFSICHPSELSFLFINNRVVLSTLSEVVYEAERMTETFFNAFVTSAKWVFAVLMNPPSAFSKQNVKKHSKIWNSRGASIGDFFNCHCWWWQQFVLCCWTSHTCRRMSVLSPFPSFPSCPFLWCWGAVVWRLEGEKIIILWQTRMPASPFGSSSACCVTGSDLFRDKELHFISLTSVGSVGAAFA